MAALLEEVDKIHLSSKRIDIFKSQVESVIPIYDLKVDATSIHFRHLTFYSEDIHALFKGSILDLEIKSYFEELLRESIATAEEKVVELSKRSHKTVFRFAALDLFKKKKKKEPKMDEYSAEVLMNKSKELKDEYNKLLGLYNKMYVSHKEVYIMQVNDGSEYYLDMKAEADLMGFLNQNQMA